MRTKRLMIVISVLLVLLLIIFKVYTLKGDFVIDGKPDNDEETTIAKEPDDLNETLDVEDIDEVEAVFAYSSLSEEVRDRIIGVSYKDNDKIKIEDLVYVQVTHWGFDDKEYTGELIVNKKIANDVVEIFQELYEAKFPIDKINIIDEYDASDELSMLDNNSSAFCYREVPGSNGKLSNHSYGIAIDINPVQNPYVKNDIILPESGKEYLDRENIRKGMIVEGDPCYNAFKQRGWIWGGEWNSLKDYQHFEFKLD